MRRGAGVISVGQTQSHLSSRMPKHLRSHVVLFSVAIIESSKTQLIIHSIIQNMSRKCPA